MSVIMELKCDYILKGIGKPEYYLGCNIKEMDATWRQEQIDMAMSPETYIQNTICKYESLLGGTLRKFKSPMEQEYHPELDESTPLNAKDASANWIITIGHFDIHYATNALAQFAMAPCEGHLQALKHVFGYLK